MWPLFFSGQPAPYLALSSLANNSSSLVFRRGDFHQRIHIVVVDCVGDLEPPWQASRWSIAQLGLWGPRFDNDPVVQSPALPRTIQTSLVEPLYLVRPSGMESIIEGPHLDSYTVSGEILGPPIIRHSLALPAPTFGPGHGHPGQKYSLVV
jgi:hypothetical protein